MSDFEFKDDHKAHIEEFFDIIDSACYSLQEATKCPDYIIDHLLNEAIGSWQIPNLEELDNALKQQEMGSNIDI